jgi:hypothetical protein
MSQPSQEDDMILQYLYLCANPLRGDDEIMQEYEALKHHPRITSLGFLRPDVLMVGTDEIIITYKNQKYLIGEFIIFLIRRQVECYWEVDFRFWNVTNPISFANDDEGNPVVNYVHPHITPANDDILGCSNGALCISQGQFGVFQYMRKGEMHLAAPRLIEILETYPTGTAYHDADNWPIYKPKGVNDA